MKLAHEENGQQTDGEVADRRKGTIHVGHGDDDVDIDAVAVNVWVEGRSSPEVGEWLALQQHQEHEDKAGQHGQHHDGVQCPQVDWPDGDAHQENADGNLAEDGGEAVGDFAEPPVLRIVRMLDSRQGELMERYLHGRDSFVSCQIGESSPCAV